MLQKHLFCVEFKLRWTELKYSYFYHSFSFGLRSLFLLTKFRHLDTTPVLHDWWLHSLAYFLQLARNLYSLLLRGSSSLSYIGVQDVDYSRYPTKEKQLHLLGAYMEELGKLKRTLIFFNFFLIEQPSSFPRAKHCTRSFLYKKLTFFPENQVS